MPSAKIRTLPGKQRKKWLRFFSSTLPRFQRVHLTPISWKRFTIAALGIGLGGTLLSGVLILNHNLNTPYTDTLDEVFRDLYKINETNEKEVRVLQGDLNGWMTTQTLEPLPPDAQLRAIVMDFLELHTASGKKESVLLLNENCPSSPSSPACRSTRTDTITPRKMGSRTTTGNLIPPPQAASGTESTTTTRLPSLTLTPQTARSLGVVAGDTLTVQGGHTAIVAGISAPPEITTINNGWTAVASTQDAAALLGHPNQVRLALVDTEWAETQKKEIPHTTISKISAFQLPAPPVLQHIQQLLMITAIAASFMGTLLGSSVLMAETTEKFRIFTIAHILGTRKLSLILGRIAEGVVIGIIALPFTLFAGHLLGTTLARHFGMSLLGPAGVHHHATSSLLLHSWVAIITCCLGGLAATITLPNLSPTAQSQYLSPTYYLYRAKPLRAAWGIVPLLAIGTALGLTWLVGEKSLTQELGLSAILLLSMGITGATIIYGPRLASFTSLIGQRKRFFVASILLQADLQRSPLRTGVTLAILAAGVITSTSASSMEAGMQRSIREENSLVMSDTNLLVLGKEIGDQIEGPLSPEVLEAWRQDPRIGIVSVRSQTVLQKFLTLNGMEPDGLFMRKGFKNTLTPENLLEIFGNTRTPQAILTPAAAQQLSVRKDDTFSLPTPHHGEIEFIVAEIIPARADDLGLGKIVSINIELAKKYWNTPTTTAILSPAPGVTEGEFQEAVAVTPGLRIYDNAGFLAASEKAFAKFMRPFHALSWALALISFASVANMIVLNLISCQQERSTMRNYGLSVHLETAIILLNALVLGGIGGIIGMVGGILLTGAFTLTGPVFLTFRPHFALPALSMVTAFLVGMSAALCGALIPILEAKKLRSVLDVPISE